MSKLASLKNRVCAVTGASGFLGGYLTHELRHRGYQVAPMTRKELPPGDVEAMSKFLGEKKATDIVHLAALANPADGGVKGFYDVNAFLTSDLLEAATRAGLPGRFIYVSATSVYGSNQHRPQIESDPLRPLNHYAASKMLGETFVRWRERSLDIRIARPSNCIGVGQMPQYLAPKLVAAFRNRDPEIIMGDVEIARDFIDVRDAANVIALLLCATEAPETAVNVSSGRATPIAEILDTLREITGHDPTITRDEKFIRAGDMRRQACDNSLALALGHKPAYTLADTLAWMLNEG